MPNTPEWFATRIQGPSAGSLSSPYSRGRNGRDTARASGSHRFAKPGSTRPHLPGALTFSTALPGCPACTVRTLSRLTRNEEAPTQGRCLATSTPPARQNRMSFRAAPSWSLRPGHHGRTQQRLRPRGLRVRRPGARAPFFDASAACAATNFSTAVAARSAALAARSAETAARSADRASAGFGAGAAASGDEATTTCGCNSPAWTPPPRTFSATRTRMNSCSSTVRAHLAAGVSH